MENVLITTAASLLLLGSAATQQSEDAASRWAETPGVTEFTGRLTIRPIQVHDLMAQGYTRAEALEINQNATRRAQQWDYQEYVPETDETVMVIPEGHDENSMAAWLMATGDYEYVEPDWLCYLTDTTPNDGGFGNQWQHAKMKSARAWDFGFGDGQFIACTVDTGVDLDHPDLEDALISGYNSASRRSQASGGDVSDINGHGTATLGCVGAIGNNGNGVVGMAWDIKLMPVRCTNSSGGSASLSNLTNGARWASDNGARSVSVSYGGGTSSSVQTTGTHLKGEGSLLCWSAGNGGNRVSGSNHSNVIIVSASNQTDDVTSWSTYGPWVDVAAPGESVRTTTNGGGNGAVSGTSFSAPIVNGVISMMMIAHPSGSPNEIEQLLFQTCKDIDAAGEDEKSGHGRPNFFRAMREATEAEWGVTNTIALSGPGSGQAGSNVSYDWTGAPASSSWDFRYSLNPYGSVIGGQRANIGTPSTSVGSGTNSGAGAGSITRKLPNGARGLRVYVEVFANSAGTTYDSNMVILNIN
ncbi:MAG: S8 family serine peptidase [Planctomycetes bacterium]|nr:S8 family serine peptidase [Planctomycetota bacterium]